MNSNDTSLENDRMKSYKVAADISKSRMAKEAPLSAAALEEIVSLRHCRGPRYL